MFWEFSILIYIIFEATYDLSSIGFEMEIWLHILCALVLICSWKYLVVIISIFICSWNKFWCIVKHGFEICVLEDFDIYMYSIWIGLDLDFDLYLNLDLLMIISSRLLIEFDDTYFEISFAMLWNMVLILWFKNGVLKITVIMTTT